jgi:hypothetical protein
MPETLSAAELAELPPKVRAVLAAQAELIAAREHKAAAAEQKAAAAEQKAAAAEENAATIVEQIGELKALNQRLEYANPSDLETSSVIATYTAG